jgi:hypothetical protein
LHARHATSVASAVSTVVVLSRDVVVDPTTDTTTVVTVYTVEVVVTEVVVIDCGNGKCLRYFTSRKDIARTWVDTVAVTEVVLVAVV